MKIENRGRLVNYCTQNVLQSVHVRCTCDLDCVSKEL